MATGAPKPDRDRKSTRLNSSHGSISYAVFCLKKNKHTQPLRRLMMRTSCLLPAPAHRPLAVAGLRVGYGRVHRGDRHDLPNLLLFFFNDTATTEIYTLSLHDALPIFAPSRKALGALAIAILVVTFVPT